ncbi:FliH/SctL family protein [Allorhodopirellula solitaria]|uniref:Flagellar assembly protein H n=1 Tax=Allorhodopirellula solitaria TaxID=2527987 RepID=A0A5C5XU74_9BACT|nr:flagellar assembly protein FliH [Allorhodopirellula solitaria]TWT66111.1 flagellar assembly protein H [Allorhodopirellula solitaria]
MAGIFQSFAAKASSTSTSSRSTRENASDQPSKGGVSERSASARIIKTTSRGSEAGAGDSHRATEFNLSDLAAQGREQIERCQQQVEQMLEQAREQAEEIKANAHAAGYAEGQRVAEATIESQVDRRAEEKAKMHVESLHTAVVQMKGQYDAWMRQYADTLADTAIGAAERLTRSQLGFADGSRDRVANPAESAPDAVGHLIVRWAREALHSTRSAQRLTLAVHPETRAQLGPALTELIAHADLPEQSAIIADETLCIGDVIVRHDGGEIHAGLDAQLKRLREQLQ